MYPSRIQALKFLTASESGNADGPHGNSPQSHQLKNAVLREQILISISATRTLPHRYSKRVWGSNKTTQAEVWGTPDGQFLRRSGDSVLPIGSHGEGIGRDPRLLCCDCQYVVFQSCMSLLVLSRCFCSDSWYDIIVRWDRCESRLRCVPGGRHAGPGPHAQRKTATCITGSQTLTEPKCLFLRGKSPRF